MAEDCIVPSYLTSRSQILERQWRLPFTYEAWDDSIYGPKVVVNPKGGYFMYYTAYAAAYAQHCIAVATSHDLINWHKPRLGLHGFPTSADSKSNNIILKSDTANLQFTDVMVDPTSGDYILTIRNDTSGSNLIYRSSDGFQFDWISGAVISGATGVHNNHVEGKAILYDPINKLWRWFYGHKHFLPTPNRRSLGYYTATNLAGPWTQMPDPYNLPEFTATTAEEQYYDFSPFWYKGSFWAVVGIFNSTTDVLATHRLYRSDDGGETWTRSTDLMRRNFTGAWDNGLTTDSCPILIDGIWYFIYGGKTGLHTGGGNATRITFGMATAVENPALVETKKSVGSRVGLGDYSKDSIIPGSDGNSRRSIFTKQGTFSSGQFLRTASDLYVYSPRILQDDDGTYFMFYTAFSSTTVFGPAVATSTDLVNWTKPTVGQITHNGNTNNNYIIWHADPTELQDVIFDNNKFVALVHNKTTSVQQLWTSPDGFEWTWLQNAYAGHHTLEGRNSAVDVSISAGGFTYAEPKSIIYTNGVYRIYYVAHFDQRRSIGYLEALTLDNMLPRINSNDGSFTDKGLIGEFRSINGNEQFYDICTFHYAGSVWAVITMYNNSTGQLGPLRLYRSSNGGTSFDFIGNLLINGSVGQWDAGLMAVGKPILVEGIWTLIYAGSPDHHEIWPRTMEFGYATGIENPAVADIKKINGARVIGDGSGVPWGPE